MPLAIAAAFPARVQVATTSDYHFTFVTFTLPTAAIAIAAPRLSLMRLLDPRLLRHARAARPLLALDSALGIGMALLVILQATFIAHVTRAFYGAALADSGPLVAGSRSPSPPVGCLPGGSRPPARAARASSRAPHRTGRTAAAHATRRARRAEGGELATAAVQGIDGLEAYFAPLSPAGRLGRASFPSPCSAE